MLLADRGFDADWIRALAAERGVWANIPPRCNRNDSVCFSPHLYSARNLIQRFFNKIKQCRRVATRYDKLAANYRAFIQLASIRLWLRLKSSRPKTPDGTNLFIAMLRVTQDLNRGSTGRRHRLKLSDAGGVKRRMVLGRVFS